MGDFRIRGLNDAVARICKDRARAEGRDLQEVLREFLEDYADRIGERLYHVVGSHRYEQTSAGTTLLLRPGATLVRHLPARVDLALTDNRGNR